MLDQGLRDRIDVYLQPNFLEIIDSARDLWEWEDSGRTRLHVDLSPDESVLCIDRYDDKKKCRCKFLSESSATGLQKSVDHILLTPNADGKWTAHLIEMKSSLSGDVWSNISLKVRASMLNMKAVAAVLDIEIDRFIAYTTYERIVWKDEDPTGIVTRKPSLGGGWKESELDRDRIHIFIPKSQKAFLSHVGIKMNREMVDGKSTLCGRLQLTTGH